MSVLVGIVSRNRAGILPRAIDSALQQQGVDLKVAVYDDNSTDNTKTLESKYPQVEWKFGEETKGYLFARNMMMKKSLLVLALLCLVLPLVAQNKKTVPKKPTRST